MEKSAQAPVPEVQLQGEREARHRLAQDIAEKMDKLESHLAALAPKDDGDRSAIGVRELTTMLEREVQERRQKEAEIVTEVAVQIEELESRISSCTLKSDGEVLSPGIKKASYEGLKKLTSDLEREVRERCDKDTEIMVRSARELAEIRGWAIEELRRLQQAWERNEMSRHNALKQRLLECCGNAQTNVESQISWDVASTVDQLRSDVDQMRTTMASNVTYDYIQSLKVDVAHTLDVSKRCSDELARHGDRLDKLDSATRSALEDLVRVISTCRDKQLVQTGGDANDTDSEPCTMDPSFGTSVACFLQRWLSTTRS